MIKLKKRRIIFWIFIIISCKEKITLAEFPAKAVVLFATGEVTSGKFKLKAGDVISGGNIKTGEKSICDIQIISEGISAVVRLKSNTEINLKGLKKGDEEIIRPFVTQGKALFNVSKLNAKKGFEVSTPTMLAGVRGTQFTIDVNKDGSTTTSVIEGTVGSRIRLKDFEDAPTEQIAKSAALAKVIENLEKEETLLEKGKSIFFSKTEIEKIASDPKVSELKKDLNSLPQDSYILIKSHLASVEKKILNAEEAEINNYKNELAELEPIVKEKLGEQVKLVDIVNERLEKNKEILMKRIEMNLDKQTEVLVLKDGSKIRGIIFKEGDVYIIITPFGTATYLEKYVEGISF